MSVLPKEGTAVPDVGTTCGTLVSQPSLSPGSQAIHVYRESSDVVGELNNNHGLQPSSVFSVGAGNPALGSDVSLSYEFTVKGQTLPKGTQVFDVPVLDQHASP